MLASFIASPSSRRNWPYLARRGRHGAGFAGGGSGRRGAGLAGAGQGITPELLELSPGSMEVVPDSLPPGAFVCGRCGLVHEDREAWNRAHSRFHPCPSCGLVHADYSISAMLGRIKVDCEIFMEQYKGLLSNDANASVRSMF